jgi:hypothetical protein
MIADVSARIDRVLLDLRSLGAEIARQDFGYPVEEATFESGAAASRIDSIAALVGEPLPSDYSYFLSRCAGFVGMDFHNGYVMHTPEEVVRIFHEAGAPQRVATGRGAIPVLPVAGDGGGNLFLLQVRLPHDVLRWDHELGDARDTVPVTHHSLQPVADSFVSLLERIRDDWSQFLGPGPASWTYIT